MRTYLLNPCQHRKQIIILRTNDMIGKNLEKNVYIDHVLPCHCEGKVIEIPNVCTYTFFLLKFLASLTSSFNNWSTFKWKYDAVDNLEDVCNCALALNSDSIRRNAYVEGWIGTWILRQILEAIYAGRSKILTFTCKQMSASLMMRGFEIVNVHLQQFQDEHWIGREWIRRVVPL